MTVGVSNRVGIAADHGGFGLKKELLARLRASGHEVVDFGDHALNSEDDYRDFVIPLARAVTAGGEEKGIDICGSGVGTVSIRNSAPEREGSAMMLKQKPRLSGTTAVILPILTLTRFTA